MKVVQPRPFTFEAGSRAVLLLHAYMSHSADVRSLGRFLEKKNYTTYAPIYEGHGGSMENVIKTSPKDWWQDVLDGYEHLQSLGYKEIAVAGLSIGGLLSLKLAYSEDVKAVISMAAPTLFDNKQKLLQVLQGYARQYKQLENKSEAEIEKETEDLMKKAPKAVETLEPFIEEVKRELHKVNIPALILQPKKDQLIKTESGPYLYDQIPAKQKQLICYHESGHVITTGPEKDQLHQDIYKFLESLDWKN